ncbi:MAG: hypothetical protein FWD83_06160, partial [Promicromonosporaceae bacterium]|nr:hypothetical protein [Promicromonosporaceae bacterium]
MAIQVSNGAFRINTANTSYWFRVTKFGHLEHLYYGPRLPDDTPAASAEALAIKRSAQPGNTVAYDQSDLLYALDVIPLEWSSSGYGDYRYSPIEAVMPDGAYSADFC